MAVKPKKRGAPKGNKNAGDGTDKVKLTCWVRSKTKQTLGPKPGAFLDATFGKANKALAKP